MHPRFQRSGAEQRDIRSACRVLHSEYQKATTTGAIFSVNLLIDFIASSPAAALPRPGVPQ
jgi:hypothetical protein